MRVVHEFKYSGGKIFRAGDLTVGDYMVYLRDPGYAINKILTEYNDKLPKLTSGELARFIKILLDVGSHNNTPRKSAKPNPLMYDDFHILYSIVCAKQGFDVCHRTMLHFLKVIMDLEVIVGKVEYDQHRHSERLDSTGLMAATGGTNVL